MEIENTNRHNTNNCPASLIQHQFWVLHSFSPDSSAYNIPLVSVIEGSFNADVLETALNNVLAKHRVFRATFHIDESGELFQRFTPCQNQPLHRVDLRSPRQNAADPSVIDSALTEEVRKPFDLTSGPLLRFKLFHTADKSHILTITAHHIVFDLATSELFAAELDAAYRAALKGQAEFKIIETADYAQFCNWQIQWIHGDECQKMHADWKCYLEGAEPSLNLPFNRPKTSVDPIHNGATLPVNISRELFDKVIDLCHREALIPFVVLMTAWALTLARLSSQHKLTLGIPLTNRRGDAVKSTMGCFVNILPAAIDLSGNPTTKELIRHIRMTLLKMHRMQEIPYYHLVQMTRRNAATSGNPLFQAGFTFEQPMQLHLENLVVTPLYIHNGGAQLDLFGKFWHKENGIAGVIEYNTDRYDTNAASIINDSFMANLNEICECDVAEVHAFSSSSTPVVAQSALTEDERYKLFIEWNNTHAEYPSNKCIHHLFEEQAHRTPNAIAIEFEGRQLTYAELNNRGSQFAKYLRSLGVGPDVLVALFVERSLDMVIALLGILKAGGAYLPLDRIFPRERLAFMLEDAKPPVLVTQTILKSDLPPHKAKVVYVDDFSESASANTEAGVPASDNLVYVLYTSGSTGTPKGVEITHRALVNFICSMRKEPGIHEEDILLSVTTISFDILGLEIWLPLSSGAKVVIASTEATMDGNQLSRIMEEHHVTMMQATPATWRLLMESGWQESPNLKILCGGEAWPEDLAKSLLSRCGTLWNMYGPTETTIWSAVCQIREGDAISLGRPIANTQFYIVDSQMQPVPAGTPGELLIGGDGLARGYLNRPELTAKKFIPDTFGPDKIARLYRTGDTVRYLPDGRLEFVGRLDQQVKIRGFRIELGDIENALCSTPGVQQAVVVVREDGHEKHLVAYIVATVDQKPSAVDLRSYLRQKLPVYMIPSSFVFIKSMPLTPNGKIDRKALRMQNNAERTSPAITGQHEIDSHIIDWNKTERPYPLHRCLQSLIEDQVRKTPGEAALKFENKTLSYEALNKRVNQLAHFLQSKGVGPEFLVGVCAFRSLEMVIALLAIIKAGGAYMPFDPTYPAKRLSYMIDDSRTPIILAHKACSDLLDGSPSQILYFEDIADVLQTCPDTNPPIQTTPDNLAYVIYTSGSTGNPKGAMNTHKGIVNRLIWMQETFQIGVSDTLVQKTPFSFDVSVWEFFWPFMFGARLVVAKPEGHKDADYLVDLISREKITVIHFVPSMLRLFLERANQERCASLRHVVLSGEALTVDLQKRYFSILKAPLHNLYGPTEAAVDVSYWKCDPLSESNVVPIGKPISNTKLYILDEDLRSLPVGQSGELHIGGVQVARGYLNRPELTEKKFVRDLFSDDPNARLYKTGDLCRFLPDGNIEYLGRIDFQVKIRGNRVELEEIEAAILKDPSVKDCAVLFREDTPGDQKLIAYVVENGQHFSVSAIRRKLAGELPDYMIPASFVLMPALPLSPSGKTDHLALPIPGRERPEIDDRYIAPRGEMERLIVKMWQDILHIDSVGIDDNFFDLGGHSLLLVRLTNALKKAFNQNISVMRLFEHPTVRKQVDFISGLLQANAKPSVEELKAPRSEGPGNDWEEGEI